MLTTRRQTPAFRREKAGGLTPRFTSPAHIKLVTCEASRGRLRYSASEVLLQITSQLPQPGKFAEGARWLNSWLVVAPRPSADFAAEAIAK